VIATLATILAWVMITILFCVLLDWRGFARIPRYILTTVFLLFFAIWSVACFAALYFARHDAATWARDALARLGRTAPLGLPALIAAAAAVLLALYWAVEKVFSEPDFADKPRVSQPDAFA
jgi:dolichyl-phosphate-mannose--protein O-mannosyl transferase